MKPPYRHSGEPSDGGALKSVLHALVFLGALYLFFFSIDLMSAAFKLSGKAFAERLLNATGDPVAGLILGLLSTSLIQSSSTTTSIVVGLVAAGTLPLRLAVPMIMGANIGTTVTNTIVSMGHVTRRHEFERAFAAGTVHDFFNILAVLVLFPLEIAFHPIEKVALALQSMFVGVGGVKFVSPLKQAVGPLTNSVKEWFPHPLPLVLIALVLLFVSLSQMVRVMRSAVLSRVEHLFDRILFRNDLSGFLLGWLLTAVVQSSSATTSIIIPLAGTGVLSIRKIFPYTMGANVGTTITAILASFATGNPVAMSAAFAHLVFNAFGIVIFYPLRSLPIGLAQAVGRAAGRSGRSSALVVVLYVVVFAVPILYLVLS
ncbi:MAG: Na/Pi symporter [Candidatus Eisenbacteria bacterium]